VIHNLDLREHLPAPIQDDLRTALSAHLLLVFRDQLISPPELQAFATIFGDPVCHEFVPALKGQDRVTEIRKEPNHRHNFGGTWHFDLSFMDLPPSATVLLAKELPVKGGDTIWSNQYLAYDSLPEHMRKRVDTLSAEHTSRLAFGGRDHSMLAVHSLAPIHPQTRRRYLYANPVSISRLVCPEDDSDENLLNYLYSHATKAEFQYRHRWQVGDMVVWDNRATMHMAVNDYPGGRVMHRVAVSDGGYIPSSS
jgi:taurine dioxygenase